MFYFLEQFLLIREKTDENINKSRSSICERMRLCVLKNSKVLRTREIRQTQTSTPELFEAPEIAAAKLWQMMETHKICI